MPKITNILGGELVVVTTSLSKWKCVVHEIHIFADPGLVVSHESAHELTLRLL